MSKQALVIAGGAWQAPIIQCLQNRGYRVTVADPYDTSPGVITADTHIKADARNAVEILEQIKGQHFDIVTSDQSDISVMTVSVIAKELGLRGNQPEVVELFVNKYLSRMFALKTGIAVPAFKIAASPAEVRKAVDDIGLPVILKPADSQSSRGIVKIDANNLHNIEELSKITFEATREDYILVEEFIDGVELTVEGICSGGKHKTIAISQKKHFRTGIASHLEYPANIPTEIEDAIINMNDLYVEASGLEIGITHAEYLYHPANKSIYLVEIACRGGGTLISSDIAKWVSGIDLYEILLNGLAGTTTDVKALQPLKRNAVLHFFEFPAGIVEKIEGTAAVKAIEGVSRFQLDFKEGDEIKTANDDRSRQGFVILYADSKKDLDNNYNLVGKLLKVHTRTK